VERGTYVTLAGTQYIYIYIYELNYACVCVLGLVGASGDVRDVGGNTVYIYVYI